jgi:hypothetical protein
MICDWMFPPAGVEPRSLWEGLHDGEIAAIVSDLLGRSLLLEVRVQHVCEHLRLDADLRFRFVFSGVRSVRATQFRLWPGAYEPAPHLSRTEQEASVRAFQAKGREESLDPAELARTLEAGSFWIVNAEMLEGAEEQAFLFEGTAGPDSRPCTLVIRAESVTIERSDGVSSSLAELLDLGRAFWNDFDKEERD